MNVIEEEASSLGQAGAISKQIGLGPLPLAFSGIWASEAWLYYVVSFVKAPFGLSWQFPYAVLLFAALVVVAWGLLFQRRPFLYEKCLGLLRKLDILMVAAACLGTLAMGLPLVYGEERFPVEVVGLVGLVFASFCVGQLFVRWGVLYTAVDQKNVIRLMVIQAIFAASATMILVFMPKILALAIVSLFPAVSLVLLKNSERSPVGERAAPRIFTVKELVSMWRIWVVLLGVALIMGIMGNASLGLFSPPTPAFFVVQKGAIVGLGVCFLGWLRLSKSFEGFGFFWRLTLLTIGLLLLIMTNNPTFFVFESLVTTLYTIVHIFFIATICSIVGRANITSMGTYTIMGLLFAAYFGMLLVSAPISSALAAMTGFPQNTSYLFFLLVAIAASSWGANDYLTRLFLEDVTPDLSVSVARKATTLAERCREAADYYNLTPRESEVLGLVCAGRTRTYIAETLFVSENTVKTHVASIYSKMNVHSKKELREFLGLG